MNKNLDCNLENLQTPTGTSNYRLSLLSLSTGGFGSVSEIEFLGIPDTLRSEIIHYLQSQGVQEIWLVRDGGAALRYSLDRRVLLSSPISLTVELPVAHRINIEWLSTIKDMIDGICTRASGNLPVERTL